MSHGQEELIGGRTPRAVASLSNLGVRVFESLPGAPHQTITDKGETAPIQERVVKIRSVRRKNGARTHCGAEVFRGHRREATPWIAHAHAANYPADVKRLVRTDSNIPRVTAFASSGIPDEMANLKTRQFAFNRLNDLPEMLVRGRERDYLAWIFATKSTRSYAIDSATLDEYTRQYSAPGAMRWFCWVPTTSMRRA